MILSKSENRLATRGFAVLFVLSAVILFWKCRFGYANLDETFYLTVPYRFCLGDSPLVHEWHLSQLSGLLLVPAMKLDRLLFPGTEGIVLRFRLLFTAVWCAAALLLFLRLRPVSPLGAAAAALTLQLYVTHGLMALDYYTMGVLLMLAAGLFLGREKQSAAADAAAGLCYAGAVLCCPTLLLLYPLFFIQALCRALRRDGALLRRWLWFTLGCGGAFLAFCLMLLSRVSFGQVLRALPWIFDDPEHAETSLLRKTADFAYSILRCNRAYIPALAALAAIRLLTGRKKAACLGAAGVCLIVAGLLAYALLLLALFDLVVQLYLDYIIFPIHLAGLYCALSSEREEIRRLFRTLWLPGALYCFCIHLSSNQVFYVIASASAVMAVASLVMITLFVQDCVRAEPKKPLRRLASLSLAVLLLTQLGSVAALRWRTVFWEPTGMRTQTVLAESGPEKGIWMTPERAQHYRGLEADAAVVRDESAITKVLFYSGDNVLYLCAQKEVAAYSAWLSGLNEHSLQRLDAYWALSPEKQPDAVYIPADFLVYAEHFLAQGYQARELPTGALLLTR